MPAVLGIFSWVPLPVIVILLKLHKDSILHFYFLTGSQSIFDLVGSRDL